MASQPDIVPKYTAKAQVYDRYRWPFSQQAAAALLRTTGLDAGAVVVDIGAGTGLSSAPFLRLGCEVYAVEPNPAMRSAAAEFCGMYANFHLIDGRGEESGLPANTADLIIVGRALHWLPQAAARREFSRLSRPGGWLAIMAVKALDEAYLTAVRSAYAAEYGWDTRASKYNRKTEPISYFFDQSGYDKICEREVKREQWDQFLGRLLTMAPAPSEQNWRYAKFVGKLERIFGELQRDGQLEIAVATEILFGRPRR